MKEGGKEGYYVFVRGHFHVRLEFMIEILPLSPGSILCLECKIISMVALDTMLVMARCTQDARGAMYYQVVALFPKLDSLYDGNWLIDYLALVLTCTALVHFPLLGPRKRDFGGEPHEGCQIRRFTFPEIRSP